MNTFITRIELHDATYEDYQKLHEEMKKLNFFKVIQDLKTFEWYHLPTAEYRSEGNISIGDVLILAKKAAVSTGRKFAAVVTQAVSITWYNLEPVI